MAVLLGLGTASVAHAGGGKVDWSQYLEPPGTKAPLPKVATPAPTVKTPAKAPAKKASKQRSAEAKAKKPAGRGRRR